MALRTFVSRQQATVLLQGTFYSLISSPEIITGSHPSGEQSEIRISVRLHPEHPVFAGHFPGNPVVPGVCQIRMITEILCSILEKELVFRSADPVKFLSTIDPRETSLLTFVLSVKPDGDDLLHCNAVISSGDKIFCKCKSVYQIREAHEPISKNL
jgi:3-hydroxyacyl-[acyl-carrier-protein] dehydratase